MHPSQDKLKSFVEGTLDDLSSNEVNKHTDTCELCREFCQDYRLLVDSLVKAGIEDIPSSAWEEANKLYLNAIKASVIPLLILTTEEADTKTDLLLAADSRGKPVQSIRNLATLYSEDPEVIMRVMHDSEQEKDYLQLISDDSSFVSFVMVQIPELDREYITDESGHVALENDSSVEYGKLKWQIRLPNAVFNLKPLSYDPDKVEYSKELVLETDNQDKIKVNFEGKTEGKQISLRILEIDGKSEFGNIRIVISQQKKRKLCEIKSNESVTFDISDSNDIINIRLFHK